MGSRPTNGRVKKKKQASERKEVWRWEDRSMSKQVDARVECHNGIQ
jgi:hypothetical protein